MRFGFVWSGFFKELCFGWILCNFLVRSPESSSMSWGSGDGTSWGSENSSSDGSVVSQNSGWGSDGSSGKGWGSDGSSGDGSGVSNNSGSWGSSDSDGGSWGSSYGNSWGSISLDMLLDSGVYNGLLNGDSLLVDDWGFNNLLDWVDLVGLSDWDSTWYWNFVWFWDMDGVDNSSFDWDWDGYWYVIRYLVNLEFWFNTMESWGDSGVGTDWGIDSIGGYGISWGWSVVGSWWWDWCWGSWDWESWGWDSTDGSRVGGWGSNFGVSSTGMSSFSGLSVLVTNLDGLGSYLDLTVSNDSRDGSVLSDGWSSMYLFMDSDWSWGDSGSNDGTCGESGVSGWDNTSSKTSSQKVTSWGSGGKSQTGRQNQKLVHVAICPITVQSEGIIKYIRSVVAENATLMSKGYHLVCHSQG